MLRVLDNDYQEHRAKVAMFPKDARAEAWWWPPQGESGKWTGQRDEWTQAWRALVVRVA